MDDQLVTFGGDEHDDFEEVRSAVGADNQPSVRVLAKVINDHRVLDGVKDVVVRDAVAASGRVDLHTRLLYYEKCVCGSASGDEGDDDVGGVASKFWRRRS